MVGIVFKRLLSRQFVISSKDPPNDGNVPENNAWTSYVWLLRIFNLYYLFGEKNRKNSHNHNGYPVLPLVVVEVFRSSQ